MTWAYSWPGAGQPNEESGHSTSVADVTVTAAAATERRVARSAIATSMYGCKPESIWSLLTVAALPSAAVIEVDAVADDDSPRVPSAGVVASGAQLDIKAAAPTTKSAAKFEVVRMPPSYRITSSDAGRPCRERGEHQGNSYDRWSMAVDVTTSVYEGPFDLLLHLILREQVDIYEVNLSRIVDAYLEEIERLQHLDLDLATEFLLIASTLVELKARRLLPGRDDIDLDDELALWEERDLLLARLLECKTFKDVAGVFSRLADDADQSFPRLVGADDRFAELMPDLMEGVTPTRLHRAFIKAVTPKVVPRIDLFHVAPIRVSVADALVELIDELPRVGHMSFRRLTSGLVERLEVIVRFLALLELFKQGLVELEQTEHFGDIDVVWTGGAEALDDLVIDDYQG